MDMFMYQLQSSFLAQSKHEAQVGPFEFYCGLTLMGWHARFVRRGLSLALVSIHIISATASQIDASVDEEPLSTEPTCNASEASLLQSLKENLTGAVQGERDMTRLQNSAEYTLKFGAQNGKCMTGGLEYAACDAVDPNQRYSDAWLMNKATSKCII